MNDDAMNLGVDEQARVDLRGWFVHCLLDLDVDESVNAAVAAALIGHDDDDEDDDESVNGLVELMLFDVCEHLCNNE